MNDFSYDEIPVGQEAEFSRVVTDEMMNWFRMLSGDENPLHKDVQFAREHKFGGVVAFGMLGASMYSTLAGIYLPGKFCLLQCVHADFLSPVFIGDTLTVNGKLVEKNDSVRQLVIKAVIKNQHGKKVGRAMIEAGMLK